MKKNGFSLIEVLVVVSIFSFLGIIVTQMIASSVRSAKKSQNINLVRGTITSAVETMNRFIRGGKGVTCSSSSQLDYTDEAGTKAYFKCILVADAENIASGSATLGDFNLVSGNVRISDCSFTCTTDTVTGAVTVDISVSGKPREDVPLSESSNVDITSKIIVRN